VCLIDFEVPVLAFKLPSHVPMFLNINPKCQQKNLIGNDKSYLGNDFCKGEKQEEFLFLL